MSKYRYHRMASNAEYWRRPHPGRLGVTNGDYLAKTGFGHEDWNFAKDTWQDGYLHFYLKQAPAKASRTEPINVVLGDYRDGLHTVVGFAENVTFGISSLPASVLDRRARDLFELSKASQLGKPYQGEPLLNLRRKLKEDEQHYWAALDPKDLIILDNPETLPAGLFKPPNGQYHLFKMEQDEYEAIKEYVLGPQRLHDTSSTSGRTETDDAAEEGKKMQRIHIARERSPALVRKAKERFIKNNGRLLCEICGLEPATHFGVEEFSNRIIEVHHDIPLSSYRKPQKTNLEDLKLLCPTCHRAIHIAKQSVEDFKNFIGR